MCTYIYLKAAVQEESEKEQTVLETTSLQLNEMMNMQSNKHTTISQIYK